MSDKNSQNGASGGQQESEEKPFHTGIYPYEHPIEHPAVLVDDDIGEIAEAILYGHASRQNSARATRVADPEPDNPEDDQDEDTPFFTHPTGDGLPIFNLVDRSTCCAKTFKWTSGFSVLFGLLLAAFYVVAYWAHKTPYELGETIYRWIARKEVMAVVFGVVGLILVLTISGVCCYRCRKRRQGAQRSGYEEIGNDRPYWRPAAPRVYVL